MLLGYYLQLNKKLLFDESGTLLLSFLILMVTFGSIAAVYLSNPSVTSLFDSTPVINRTALLPVQYQEARILAPGGAIEPGTVEDYRQKARKTLIDNGHKDASSVCLDIVKGYFKRDPYEDCTRNSVDAVVISRDNTPDTVCVGRGSATVDTDCLERAKKAVIASGSCQKTIVCVNDLTVGTVVAVETAPYTAEMSY